MVDFAEQLTYCEQINSNSDGLLLHLKFRLSSYLLDDPERGLADIGLLDATADCGRLF